MNSSFHTSTYAGPQQTASQLSFLLCIHQVLISKCWANKHPSHQQVGQLNIWLSCWGLQERFGSLGGRTKIHLMITVWYNCMLNKSETAVWDWCLLKVMFMKITVWGQRKKNRELGERILPCRTKLSQWQRHRVERSLVTWPRVSIRCDPTDASRRHCLLLSAHNDANIVWGSKVHTKADTSPALWTGNSLFFTD